MISIKLSLESIIRVMLSHCGTCMTYLCLFRFGGPFVLQVNVEISFLELQADILRNMAAMLRDGMLTQVRSTDHQNLFVTHL